MPPIEKKPEAKRPPGNPSWVRGGPSPNPAGRPKLSAEARKWIDFNGGSMDELALKALQRAMVQSKNLAVSLKAAEVWLNKRMPAQFEVAATLTASGPDLTKLSTEQLKVFRDLMAIAAGRPDTDAGGD